MNKNEEALCVLMWKVIQDKSLCEKKQREVQNFKITTFYIEKKKKGVRI